VSPFPHNRRLQSGSHTSHHPSQDRHRLGTVGNSKAWSDKARRPIPTRLRQGPPSIGVLDGTLRGPWSTGRCQDRPLRSLAWGFPNARVSKGSRQRLRGLRTPPLTTVWVWQSHPMRTAFEHSNKGQSLASPDPSRWKPRLSPARCVRAPSSVWHDARHALGELHRCRHLTLMSVVQVQTCLPGACASQPDAPWFARRPRADWPLVCAGHKSHGWHEPCRCGSSVARGLRHSRSNWLHVTSNRRHARRVADAQTTTRQRDCPAPTVVHTFCVQPTQ